MKVSTSEASISTKTEYENLYINNQATTTSNASSEENTTNQEPPTNGNPSPSPSPIQRNPISDTSKSKKEKALEMALDTRKFEIELYWKRATYFWAFIALAFTSFFLVADAENMDKILKNELQVIISALGIFLSVCWFLANKGSKYWQENWEFHVDLLEDEIMGPLYKTTKSYKGRKNFLLPWKSYKFSVGKINMMLSATMIIFWIVVFIEALTLTNYTYNVTIIIILLVLLLFLIWNARSTGSNGQGGNNSFDQRQIDDDTSPESHATIPPTGQTLNTVNKKFSFFKYFEVIGLALLLSAFGWEIVERKTETLSFNREWYYINEKLDQIWRANQAICETVKCPQYKWTIGMNFGFWPKWDSPNRIGEQHETFQNIRCALYILGSLMVIIGRCVSIKKENESSIKSPQPPSA
ncbi:hypothetical protein SAMN05720473_11342 [Fibrobacter sp. UWB15]|uniref:RipA family octameric membrane protein n=1 Tax=unclassified Fibrobacter TaxID=2634177 RepID=UPI00091F3FE6|nr:MULTISPECIES: hypothetical protein [unclassified Fibrobacter]PWJ61965.1 hypothetical protein BGW99_11442 [Fibrobacter sp. UWB6]SHG57119.1 hypothetical protein SAMN05720760_11513 [Fibrobacter sp. UWB8]SMG42270.1 hypothetical protein SAMN05720473_11342 [Fibrobacter sp. UWB15]